MKRIIIICVLTIFTNCTNLLGPEVGSSNVEIFDNIWEEYNNLYALFDVCKVDWNSTYKEFRPQIDNNMSEKELFNKISEMLDLLNDTHVKLISSFDVFTSGGQGESIFDFEITKGYLDEVHTVGDNNIVYGKIDDKAYIYIRTFNYDGGSTGSTLLDWAKKIDKVITYIEECDSVILDIRSNGGGLPQTAMYIVQRFVDKKRLYQYISNKTGPGNSDFGEKRAKYIKPEGTKQYTAPVYLLTDDKTASASEDFTMALMTLPNVTHVGNATRGIFSTAIARDLPNGWRYTISIQKVTDTNGRCHEGIGIIPKEENIVSYKVEDKNIGVDTQLEFILDNF